MTDTRLKAGKSGERCSRGRWVVCGGKLPHKTTNQEKPTLQMTPII